MKKILFSAILALAMLFACEKDNSTPALTSDPDDTEVTSLKSAVNKNAVIVDEVKECLRTYFDGMETKDWDLMKSLVTDEYLVLEQGELFDVQGHIDWLQEIPSFLELRFTFDYVDILVKGTTAWVVYYDHLEVMVDGTVVDHWEGLESAVLMKKAGEWKMVMLTATEIPEE